jgi:hypothetical protein
MLQFWPPVVGAGSAILTNGSILPDAMELRSLTVAEII